MSTTGLSCEDWISRRYDLCASMISRALASLPGSVNASTTSMPTGATAAICSGGTCARRPMYLTPASLVMRCASRSARVLMRLKYGHSAERSVMPERLRSTITCVAAPAVCRPRRDTVATAQTSAMSTAAASNRTVRRLGPMGRASGRAITPAPGS